jgi:charged multivesicular body protein 6
MQIFEAIKAGKDALEEIHKEMSLEAVEKLLQDTEDAMVLQK